MLDHLVRYFRPAVAAALLASVVLAIFHFRHMPVSPDGGFYSYPSFAWANGGDPSENMLEIQDIAPGSDRLVAKFMWENRLNLAVPLLGLWFKIMPASWVSIFVLGTLTWLAIAALAGWLVFYVSRDRAVSAATAILTLGDSRLITQTVSDARPDVPVLFSAFLLLAALITYFKAPTPPRAAVAAIFAVALPLMHVTSAIPVAFIIAFIGLSLLLHWRVSEVRRSLYVAAALAVLTAAIFILRLPILDVLVPTDVSPEIEAGGQHRVSDRLKEILDMGFTGKLAMELERWAHQFHAANLAQLLFLLWGGFAVWRLMRRRPMEFAGATAIAILGAFVAGAVAMFAVDPHHTPGHALPLAVMAYAGTGIALTEVSRLQGTSSMTLGGGLTVLLSLCAALKFVHSGYMTVRYADEGVSNAAIEKALNSAVPPGRSFRITGGSELWPYLSRRNQRIEIVDPNRMTLKNDPPDGPFAGAGIIILNEDHYRWGWGELAAKWVTEGRITKLSAVGDCRRTPRCLEIYEIKSPQ